MTTTAAAALADTSRLPDYLNRPTTRTKIAVTNAGDGLSEGLSIDPQVLIPGETVYVVLECVVNKHTHERLMDRDTDLGQWCLVQSLKAGTGTLMDADVVKQAIADQADKIQRAKEAAAGIARLPFDDEDAEAFQAEHDDGQHTDLVDGCPSCDEERAAVEAGD